MPSATVVCARIRISSMVTFRRASERTRAIRWTSSIGLVRKSSAPASSPRTRSAGWSSAVTITTGRCEVAIWAFQPPAHLEAVHLGHHHVEQNDVDEIPSRTGRVASGPLETLKHLEIFVVEADFEQLAIGGVVVDDEDAGGHRLGAPRKWSIVSKNFATEIGLDR